MSDSIRELCKMAEPIDPLFGLWTGPMEAQVQSYSPGEYD